MLLPPTDHPLGFGIDLSDLSVKIIQFKKHRGFLKLSSFNRQEISEGLIEEGEIRKEPELVELIKKTAKEVKGEPLRTKFCIVSLPETESFVRMIQLPMMETEEAGEAIKWELEANIPLALDEIYYDWQIIENNDPEKKQLDVLIGVLPKKTVDPYLDVLKKAGLKPIIFEIESIATARALIQNGFAEKPVLIVDFGAKRSSLFIASGQTIYFTTSLPVCNTSLVKTLNEKLKIGEKKALAIKMKVGLDLKHQKGKIFNALSPQILEVIEKIKIFSSFFKEHYPIKQAAADEISEILLCGGGANLKGLPEFLSSKLNLKVSLGNPWINITDQPNRSAGKFDTEESLSFTTAFGLALRNFNQP